MANLCDYCKQIPFFELSSPTASNEFRAHQAAKWDIDWYSPPVTIGLGTLRRLHQDKEHCRLCGLFCHVIQQRGYVQGTDNTLLSGDDENLNVDAHIDVFAFVTDSISNSSKDDFFGDYSRAMWRLSLEVKLERDNDRDLQVEDALEYVKLPQTIRDAIDVTRKLGFEYLWVDALCVRQGQHESDKEDRAYQLKNMGEIYRWAFLTIIAAFGEGANAGLPGIRPGSRQEQQVVEVIPRNKHNNLGMALITTCESPPVTGKLYDSLLMDNEVDYSYWNTRGWTFQERALSRRCLIFAKEQVYWVCDGAIFCEESTFEHIELYEDGEMDKPRWIELYRNRGGPLSWKTIDGPLARATPSRDAVWAKVEDAVRTFSRRSFGRQEDVYDAFQGVAGAFERMYGETFLLGHPRSHFVISLLWGDLFWSDVVIRRRSEDVTSEMNSLDQHVILPSWSWMGWIGDINLNITRAGDSDFWSQGRPERIPVICCYEHQGSDLEFRPVHGTDEIDLEDVVTREESSSWRGDRTLVTRGDVEREYPELTASKLRDIPDGHILFFWASSASFVVKSPTEPDVRPATNDSKGEDVEHLGESQDLSRSTHGTQEFVVIGRDPERYRELLALQIYWADGVAFRVNSAEFDEWTWRKANPVWKLMALM
ncbi:hypothetical protein VMCG_03960 [Cytospora schulzeri]|uniref:Heterokaryon incompatibility domain-containing protein n=1 Tax=Cytospora schulzeri TaxID=448051 RepID=A0A423WTF8_9PEZI|nr:hypothetical protein VMCG_03960 [Valsa malicola]